MVFERINGILRIRRRMTSLTTVEAAEVTTRTKSKGPALGFGLAYLTPTSECQSATQHRIAY
eukprot:6100826-Amphidinium_carterae.1